MHLKSNMNVGFNVRLSGVELNLDSWRRFQEIDIIKNSTITEGNHC